MRVRLLVLLLLALPALCHSQYKPWYNMFNFAYGAKAGAMGNAFTAVADDLTAAYWNPAGLASLRTPMLYLSYKTSKQYHDYDLQSDIQGGSPWLYNYNFDSHLNQIDFFSVSAPVTFWKRPCTFALGYYRYIPYGFKGKVRETLTYLSMPNDPQKITRYFTGSEGFDVLAFSFSAAATRYFSLGVTLQQFFSSGSLHFQTTELGMETHREVTESVRGRNFIVGALFSPFQFLRLGVSWHSGLKSQFASDLLTWEVNTQGEKFNEAKEDCQAWVVIPKQYALGLLLQPAHWLDVSADYSLIEWDKGTIEGYYGSALMSYPQMTAWESEQKQVRNLRFGFEARIPFRSWRLHLRGGWSLDHQLYTDQLNAGVKVKSFSTGVGCEFSPNFLMEITYQRQNADWMENGYIYYDVVTHFRANVFFLALTYRFGHIFKD